MLREPLLLLGRAAGVPGALVDGERLLDQLARAGASPAASSSAAAP
ncbi:MAG TPA: hypothetical protein VF469_10560 [Kofleriaceae bacterium]